MQKFWAIVVILAAAFYVSDRYSQRSPVIEADGSEHPPVIKTDGSPTARGVATLPTEAPPRAAFQCDGRTHCSQMHSCAEAKYFLANCPGTEMDGDGDGIPCERQWCG